jgi:glycosyltransferase involved in cell wall biosynthesis
MVGDGPLNGELKNLVSKLGLENEVTFLGWLNEPHKYIASMDVVAHPTLQEAFPQIMVETMALQVPLIITKVSGASDIVRNGWNGLLIEPGSSEPILSALLKIASDPSLAEALGQHARLDVTRDLGIENVVGSFEKVYEELSD